MSDSQTVGAPERVAFFISDRTGITAQTLGQSLLAQFESIRFQQVAVPFINTAGRAEATRARIDAIQAETGLRPVLFSTIIDPEIRRILTQANGLYMDLIDTFLGPLEAELQMRSDHMVGQRYGKPTSSSYKARIDAMHFALDNDDGVTLKEYDQADVILVGVSRSGKTPTCLYLALQYGVYPANYPLTEDDLEGRALPRALQPYRDKLYGLSIDPARLQSIRSERRPDSRYASLQQCRYEIQQVEQLFRRARVPFLNTTTSSIEEIAAQIVSDAGLSRRYF